MSLPTISPKEARRLLDQGGMLIDIRGRDEHARERIEGAKNIPVESLTTLDDDSRIAIFHCRSGQRTALHAGKLAEAASCEAYIIEGGIEAWKKAGLPIARDRHQPIEVQRQVMIAAGSLVLLGVLLALPAPGPRDPDMDLAHRPDRAGLDQLDYPAVVIGGVVLRAHLRDDAGLFGGLGD